MKSKLLLSCAVALGLVFAASFGAVAATTIKLAHSSPATNDRLESACQIFKKYVEEKTGGAVKVDTFPGSQLGAEREQLEGVQMGSIEMAALSAGPFPTLFAEIMVFDIPFLFASEEIAYKIMDGPVGTELREKFRQKTGVRCVAFGENGFRNFTSNVAVTKPEDLKGLKIRVMENPAHMQMVRELGAIPTPIPFSELYTALAQGVVDAQENPASLVESMRFYEVQKFMVLDRHVYNPYLLIMNDDFYKALTPEQQKVIDEASQLFAKEERRLNREQIASGIGRMQKAGLTVTELEPGALERFRAMVQPKVIETIKKQVPPATVDAFVKAVAEAEASTK